MTYHATYSRAEMRQSDSNTFPIAFFDAVAVRKNVNFSHRISIEKVVSENIDRKSDFFYSIRRIILPKIEKGSSSTAFFDSIRNGLSPFLTL